MREQPDVIISDFQRGIADSPVLGYGDMRNIDIYSAPGVLRLGLQATKQSSTTVVAQPVNIVRNPINADLFCSDTNGKIYTSTDNGGSWSVIASSPNQAGTRGLFIYRDYLFVVLSTNISVYGTLSGSPSWTNNFGSITLNATGNHSALVGQDDIAYICDGRYIDSLTEVSGKTFSPSDATTYTFTTKALSLPKQYTSYCLAELGKNLMIGTFVGTTVNQNKVADIFPWDRSSTSFSLPIRLQENGINQMLTVGTNLYIQAGTKNFIYVTNGFFVQEVKPMRHLNFASGDFIANYPAAIMLHQNKVMFGTANGSGNPYPMGVFSIREGVLVMENTISTGNVGNSSDIKIGCLFSLDADTFLIGWGDGSTFGIDKVGVSLYKTASYGGYVDSQLFPVGTAGQPRTFGTLEVELATALTTGQGVRVSYRKDNTSSFTVLATFDYATYSGEISFTAPAPITDATQLQIRIELTTGASSTTTPQVLTVRLR